MPAVLLQMSPTLQTAGTQAIIASDFGATGNISKTFRWTPPLNGTGDYVVMTLRAFDGNDFSVSAVDVRMSVSGSNAAPKLANTTINLGEISGTTGTKQNVPLVISYDTLLARSGATDSDFTPVSFKNHGAWQRHTGLRNANRDDRQESSAQS